MCSSTSNHYHSNCCCCNHRCRANDRPLPVLKKLRFPYEVLPNLEAEQKLEAILALVPERTNRPNNGIDDADYEKFNYAAREVLLNAPASMLDGDIITKLFSVLHKSDYVDVFLTCTVDRQHLMAHALDRHGRSS